MNKKIQIILFIIVALFQLFVPAKTVIDKENILLNGKTFHFLTAPVDPNDPFRGKYIALEFKEIDFTVENEKDWHFNEPIYVLFTTDNNGYAKIKSISKRKPHETKDYINARIHIVTNNGSNEITIKYPFDRFYLEETKAVNAEKYFLDALRDTNQTTYAKVKIINGKAVITDVLINDKSVKDIVNY